MKDKTGPMKEKAYPITVSLIAIIGAQALAAGIAHIFDGQLTSTAKLISQVLLSIIITWYLIKTGALGFRLNRSSFVDGVVYGFILFSIYCGSATLLAVAHGYNFIPNEFAPKVFPRDAQYKMSAGAPSIEMFSMFALPLLITPIFEELTFRGTLYAGMRRIVKMPVAVLVVSLLFALMHAPHTWLNFFVASLILCSLVDRHRALYAAVIAHALYNIIITINMYTVRLGYYPEMEKNFAASDWVVEMILLGVGVVLLGVMRLARVNKGKG